ncbi:cytochrome P450, partial [Methylophaga sp. OBS4]|uniref:cytochrome P450 n=1 Tax=Methylophaga sp. OBS4 TaxID=2991935 RepID=UPI002255172E
ASLYEPLRKWTRGHHAATLAADRKALGELASRFDTLVSNLLAERRAAGTKRVEDVTSRLMAETVEGRNLTDEEITSILRNWTVGELGTISACVGILLHYLAEHTALQQRLRAEPELLPAAIDEILRMDAPLLANRRVTTCPTKIGDRELDAGERLTIMWGSANRDEKVFGDPDEFRLDRNPQDNLLYGAGIHVCPGAPLARMELLFFVEALLSQTTDFQAVADKPAVRAHYPTGGYSTVPLYVKC